MVYAPVISITALLSLMTTNEFLIGLMTLPLVAGTIVGSKIAGKTAKPRRVPLTDAQKDARKFWDSQSFLRTFFPWSMVRNIACSEDCTSTQSDRSFCRCIREHLQGF